MPADVGEAGTISDLVEDDPTIRQNYVDALTRAGFDTSGQSVVFDGGWNLPLWAGQRQGFFESNDYAGPGTGQVKVVVKDGDTGRAIGTSLDKKIAAIRAQLDEAKALREEAEALKAEYEAKAKAADADAANIVDRAHAEAQGIIAKAGTDAEALVARRQAMAEAKIAAEERAAIDELRATTARAASAAAAKLIAERNDASSDAKLVDQAIAGL